MRRILTRLLPAVVLLARVAAAQTTIDPAHSNAYSANAGWVTFLGDSTHGVAVGEFILSGYAYGANIGWIALGNGAPLDGIRYSNTASDDFGVNHDGQGGLSGYAYSANVGWIRFDAAQGCPRVDLLTGVFSGSAYGANIGWISLSNLQAHVRTATLAPSADSEPDGIPDTWERIRRGTLDDLAGGGADFDGDGVPDTDEYGADTDPADPADRLRIRRMQVTYGGATNVVLTWTSRPSRLYRIERDGAPRAGWNDAGPGPIAPEADADTEHTLIEPPATGAVYRVRAMLPFTSP